VCFATDVGCDAGPVTQRGLGEKPALLERERAFRDMKRRRSYRRPSTKATREKGEAVRRARKQAREKAVREGGSDEADRPSRVSADFALVGRRWWW
jgi:hypothetical protein